MYHLDYPKEFPIAFLLNHEYFYKINANRYMTWQTEGNESPVTIILSIQH